ncbi:MAG: transcriptional repressor [Actinomycetota bacterium]|nr:transcriptional repressor [Actinomycetota bacterium]
MLSRPTIVVVDTSLRRTLHERGMRMTPQRQLVLDAVRDLEHATPERICEHVQHRAPAVNITTIYRTLDLLEGLNLVRHTHLGHGAPSYSTQPHEHVHLVCHRCGEITEIPTEELTELAERLRQRFGFVLDPSHLALSGRCADCIGQDGS